MRIIKAVILLILLVLACVIGNELLNEGMITQYSADESLQIHTRDDAVNINTADNAELDKLKHVGEKIAQNIIEYRDEFGDFKNVEQVKNVDGIGDKIFDDIKNYITVK